MKIQTLDTTLRDGAQSPKVSFSVADKLKIVTLLDELGIDYIEAGNPISNVKDREFFKEAEKLNLKHSRLAAFGSTRFVHNSAENDSNLNHLAQAFAPVTVIFGKAWDLHVTEILNTSLDENLRMIDDSIRYLRKFGKEVIFDAEHFFDGYKHNPGYALQVIKAASDAGASCVCLCDTNGGVFPDEIGEITQQAVEAVSCSVGIHTHNDGGMAVSNSIMAVTNGATHIQGTLNGIGERCGNANLATIIANLQLKKNYPILPELSLLTPVARSVAEISNISVRSLPYISKTAFSHKAGMHIDGVLKNSASFEHIDPASVGNERTFLVSEVAGKSALMPTIQKIAPDLDKSAPEIQLILDRLKKLEFDGYQFEGAPASLELEITKILGLYKPLFDLDKFRLISELDEETNDGYSSAFIKVLVGSAEEITAADSTKGPVNAFDKALRKALERFFPAVGDIRLTDYKVRVINPEDATGAKIRVLIESTDGADTWNTVGVSTDIIMASKKAVMDSVEYKLLKDRKKEQACQ